MCSAITYKCKACHLRAATEVTGDEAAIKREFNRIDHACQKKNKRIEINVTSHDSLIEACQHKMGWELKYNVDAQTKTPSAVTDGV